MISMVDGTIVQQRADAVAIGFFEKYLSVWVFLCMVVGGLIGAYIPSISEALAKAEFAQINAIVAVLLWLMILPMLILIDFASLKSVKNNLGAIAVITCINYLIQPFTMYALAILFFRVIYIHVIPNTLLADNYIAGLVLLGSGPCTAMVFVWSALVGGDPAYTLVQVAVNDLLLLCFYVPTVELLIGVSNIELPWETLIYAVLLFIVAPLVLAVTMRVIIITKFGLGALTNLVDRFKPVTVICLLLTLVLIFIFQGQKIADKPLHIVLIAIPIIIQCVLIFIIAYAIGYYCCIPHSRLAPGAMIATSNFFELAVAVAISVYGLDSGAALATVVGVLVEVPLMLFLVELCIYLRPYLDDRVRHCLEECSGIIEMEKRIETVFRMSSNENS